MIDVLGEWSDAKYYTTMQQALFAFANKALQLVMDKINDQLSCMQAHPFTYSDKYEGLKRYNLEALVRQRCPYFPNYLAVPPLTEIRAPTFALNSSHGERRKWYLEVLQNDEYGHIIDCLATVRTSHEIMAGVLTDAAGMYLKSHVLGALKGESADMLWDELKVDDAGYCATLLAESEERQRQLDELATEKGKLEL